MIQAVTPAANQPYQRTENPILTRPNAVVFYEEFVPAKGMKDIKDFPAPAPFNGKQYDTTPFINRVLGYFKSKPESMKFTQARILYTCNLLQDGIANSWANAIRKALTLSTAQNRYEHYTDNWNDFVAEFKKRYGLQDEKRYWQRLMMQYKQLQGQKAKNFTDQFDDYRKQAEVDEAQAFHYLRQNTFPMYRSALVMRKPPSQTYQEWINELAQLQEGLDDIRDFELFDKPAYVPKNTHYQKFQPSSVPGYGPMQIDQIQALEQQLAVLKGQKGKKVVKKSGPGQKRLAPHPTAGNLRQPVASTSKAPGIPRLAPPSKKTDMRCYVCNQKGHFARDCRPDICTIDVQHVNNMETALQQIYALQGFQEEDVDESAILGMAGLAVNEEEDPLIDMDGSTEQQEEEEDNDDEAETQDGSFF